MILIFSFPPHRTFVLLEMNHHSLHKSQTVSIEIHIRPVRNSHLVLNVESNCNCRCETAISLSKSSVSKVQHTSKVKTFT